MEKQIHNSEKVYAVTGQHHGSIVTAKSKKEAGKIFKNHYSGEKIWFIRDISESNLYNL